MVRSKCECVRPSSAGRSNTLRAGDHLSQKVGFVTDFAVVPRNGKRIVDGIRMDAAVIGLRVGHLICWPLFGDIVGAGLVTIRRGGKIVSGSIWSFSNSGRFDCGGGGCVGKWMGLRLGRDEVNSMFIINNSSTVSVVLGCNFTPSRVIVELVVLFALFASRWFTESLMFVLIKSDGLNVVAFVVVVVGVLVVVCVRAVVVFGFGRSVVNLGDV